MRITLQVVVQDEGETPATVTEIAQFERQPLMPDHWACIWQKQKRC